jgi:hypothetical protein
MELRKKMSAAQPCGDQQAAIEKQIPHFATGLGDQKATMARGAMSRPVSAFLVRIMIGADRVVRADSQAVQGIAQNDRKPRRGSNQPAESTLAALSGSVKSSAACS